MTITEIPDAPQQAEASLYDPRLLGKRVRHKYLDIYGRLNGEVRFSRGTMWAQAETNAGRFWWIIDNLTALGPIPVPCPQPPKRSA